MTTPLAVVLSGIILTVGATISSYIFMLRHCPFFHMGADNDTDEAVNWMVKTHGLATWVYSFAIKFGLMVALFGVSMFFWFKP